MLNKDDMAFDLSRSIIYYLSIKFEKCFFYNNLYIFLLKTSFWHDF